MRSSCLGVRTTYCWWLCQFERVQWRFLWFASHLLRTAYMSLMIMSPLQIYLILYLWWSIIGAFQEFLLPMAFYLIKWILLSSLCFRVLQRTPRSAAPFLIPHTKNSGYIATDNSTILSLLLWFIKSKNRRKSGRA